MDRSLLSQKEFDAIAQSGDFAQALSALSRYVRKKVGRPRTGRAMTSTERTHKRRARLRQQKAG